MGWAQPWRIGVQVLACYGGRHPANSSSFLRVGLVTARAGGLAQSWWVDRSVLVWARATMALPVHTQRWVGGEGHFLTSSQGHRKTQKLSAQCSLASVTWKKPVAFQQFLQAAVGCGILGYIA